LLPFIDFKSLGTTSSGFFVKRLIVVFFCRCSQKSRKFGIRHGIFPGEENELPKLDPDTNNAGKLYHYRVTISPPTNFLVKVKQVW
jgi:hypothetical protein